MHRFSLQKYDGKKTLFTCPNCHTPFKFIKYIDNSDNSYIADDVGRCNRIDKCGYHKTPKEHFLLKGFPIQNSNMPLVSYSIPKAASVIPFEIYRVSLNNYNENCFVQFLNSKFKNDIVKNLINEYRIGTSDIWSGGTTIFWQIDSKGRVKAGKLMKYDRLTGKRLKNPFPHINWVHSKMKFKDFNLEQCLFGEHLLNKYPNKTIGIVESEKTAIINSCYIKDILWLATGSANNLNDRMVKAILNRDVILFPDTSNESKILKIWEKKADGYGFKISVFTEYYSKENNIKFGVDIADFLIDIKLENDLNTATEGNSFDKNESKGTVTKLVSYNIPYYQPSPARIIDKELNLNTEIFKSRLSISKRKFLDENNNEIEIIGIINYGRCESSGHKWKGICPLCMFNCVYSIKINSEIQSRKYSHQEILLMKINARKAG